MSKINHLQEEITRIHNLINETNEALDLPVSNLQDDFEQSASRLAGYFALQLRNAVKAGRPQNILIAGAVMGAGWLVATGIDEFRNTKASTNARKALTAYYQELAAKHNLLIQEQQKLIQEMATQKFELEANRIELQQRLAQVTDIINKIAQAQQQRSV